MLRHAATPTASASPSRSGRGLGPLARQPAPARVQPAPARGPQPRPRRQLAGRRLAAEAGERKRDLSFPGRGRDGAHTAPQWRLQEHGVHAMGAREGWALSFSPPRRFLSNACAVASTFLNLYEKNERTRGRAVREAPSLAQWRLHEPTTSLPSARGKTGAAALSTASHALARFHFSQPAPL